MSMALDKTTEVKVYSRVKIRDMRKDMVVMLGAFTPFRINSMQALEDSAFRVSMTAPDGTTVFANYPGDWEYDMLGDFDG